MMRAAMAEPAMPARDRGRLADFIGAFRAAPGLDKAAAAVLDRLLKDDRASEIVDKIADDDRAICRILWACIEAEQVARTFHTRVKAGREALEKRRKREAALALLREFVDQATKEPGPADLLSARIVLDEGDLAAARRGLYTVEWMIRARARIAAETPPRIGATRKTASRKNAEAAAIWWLSEGIRGACGQPHNAHVAVLAEIALDIGEVDVEHVRKLRRSRQDRDWRAPL